MKLVFFGTAEFAAPALRALAESVVMVVSQPDRPSGRGMKLSPAPVKRVALDLGLAVETPERARAAEFVEHIRALRPDALVVAAYGQILSQTLLDCATFGGINIHGSILPKYRGAAPIQRAILAGEAETGVSVMQMDRGMDTGDVIAISKTSIGADETYGELQFRLAEMGADLAAQWLPRIVTGNYPRTPQDDRLATHAAKVARDEAELRFEMGAEEAYTRFRAFTPAPGAFIRSRLGRLRVRAALRGTRSGSPGELLGEDEIAFAEGSLKLAEIQLEGKRPMSLREFANGIRLGPGSNLS